MQQTAALTERFSAWQPSIDEQTYPDNAWFYRAFDCLRAEWPEQVERWNGLFHNAICWGRGELKPVLQTLVSTIERMETPAKPFEHYSCDSEPLPDENEPFRIFTQQFKTKWPGKRINSAFAKEKWEQVKHQAQEIADSQFKIRHNAWEEREQKRNQAFAKNLAEWQSKADNLADLRAFAKQVQEYLAE